MFNACSNDDSLLFSLGEKDFWTFQHATQNFTANEEGKITIFLQHLSQTSTVTPVTVTVDFGDNADLFIVANTRFTSVDNLGRAVIEITYNEQELGFTPYTIVLSIPEQNYPVAGSLINSMSVNIARPLTFTEVGVGTFISDFFEEEWEQEVLLADQVAMYRLPNLYESGRAIDVVDNGDGTVSIASQHAWTHATHGAVHVEGTGTKTSTTITMALRHYVPGVGSFGTFDEVLILPD